MRKIYSLVLMAVGLLISGNLRAEGDSDAQNGVAQIGDQYYSTLALAVADVPETNDETEIVILKDIMSNDATVATISKDQNVKLDLNGKTICMDVSKSGNFYTLTTNGGSILTIDDSSVEKCGKVVASNTNGQAPKDYVGWVFAAVRASGTFTLLNGTLLNSVDTETGRGYYYGLDCDIQSAVASKIYIKGGKIEGVNNDKTNGCYAVRLYTRNADASVEFEMTGGEIIGGGGVYQQLDNHTKPNSFTIKEGVIKIIDPDMTRHRAFYSEKNATINIGTETTCPQIDGICVTEGDINLTVANGNFTSHNVFRIDKMTADKYKNSISGGTFFFDQTLSTELTPIYTLRFADDSGLDYAVTVDGFGKFYGDLKNKAGWETLGYVVSKYGDEIEGRQGPWWTVNKQIEATAAYDIFLNMIADGYTAVDITGQDNGNGGTYPEKTVEIKKVEEVHLSGTDTWTSDETDETSAVIIDADANITIPAGTTVKAYSVNVPTGTTLNVEAGATLIVGAGGVTTATKPETISINIGSNDGSGAIKISPDAPDEKAQPRVRVKLKTKAHAEGEEGNEVYHWQYFARPTGMTPESFSVAVNPSTGGATKHFIYGYRGTTNDYEPISDFTQLGNYQGYAITNNSTDGGVVYQFEGQLNANKNAELKFTNSNFTLLGNSYLAPVSMDGLFAGIRESAPASVPARTVAGNGVIEYTIWLYDHDQKRFVQTNQLQANRKKSTAQLQPMQGFFMRLMEGSSLTTQIDYVGAVWNNNVQAGPILAPARNQTSDIAAASVVISANGCADQVDLFEDAEFDNTFNNGADASKLMNINNMFNLYAETEVGTLSCVASDNLEGTILTFQANNASEYELSFKDVENMNYSLIDLVANRVIRMNEVYTFNATPNSTEERFQIVSAAQTPTMMDKVIYKKAAKGIYSMTGAYFGEVRNFNTLPSGVYVVNGEMIVK